DAELGWGPPVAVDDGMLTRTVELGDAHERRHLEALREASDDADDPVTVIGRPAYTVEGLTAAAEATLRAVQRRAPVIYQATMFDGRFVGFAGFPVHEPADGGGRYRLRPHKPPRSREGAAPP